MRWLRLSCLVAVPALVAGVIAFPGLAGPAQADATLVPGTALPGPVVDRPMAGIASSSAQYLLLQGGEAYDELDPHLHFSVLSRSDGHQLYAFNTPDGDSALRPRLVGSSIVQLVRPDSDHSRIDVRDATTGALQRSMDISGTGLVHADTDWVMVGVSTGPTTGDNGLRIIQADGSQVDVPGNFFNVPTWVGGDQDTAYVSAWEGNYAVDVHTGAKTLLPFPGNTKLFAVTPTELIASSEDAAPDGVWRTHFRALDRTTLAPTWSTDVPTDYRNEGFVTFGTGIAQMYRPDDAADPAYEHLQLRPVDLGTGALEQPVASDVYSFTQLPDEKVALTFADTPGGRLAIADADGVHPLIDLPDVNEQALDVGLSGGVVAASWQMRDGVWTAPSDGSGTWSDSLPNPGFAVGDDDKDVTFAGDVVMTVGSPGDGPPSSTPFHFQWPGGSRDITANVAILGHGGKYALRVLYGGSGSTQVIDVRSGAVATTYAGTTYRSIDGDWMWNQPDANAVMVATDLTGAAQPRSVQLPPACANAAVKDVRGRWAWLTCGASDRVVDLTGQVPAYSVPAGGTSHLGNGFMATVKPITAGTSYPLQLSVTDLVTGESRSYGPVRGNLYPPGQAVAVDDAGGQDLAYIDPTYQVRHVVLDWLASASAEPVLSVSPVVPSAYASTSAHQLDLSWSWFDATTYDVRRGDRTGTTWTMPEEWQGLGAATISASIEPGTGACFSSRAHGADGSVSPWSPPVCQYVDGAAPVVTALPELAPVVGSKVAVVATASWSYEDPSSGLPGSTSIASYDVRRSGGPDTSWTQPASWQGLAQPTVTVSIAPGTSVCLSSRARDEAGNVSEWSAPRCEYVDAVAPVVGPVTGSPAYPTKLFAPVTFAATATDDDQVASYDVDQATALPGQGLGSWARVVDAGPQAQVATGGQTPGSEVCFRVRARDTVGNTSDWSPPRCTTAPVDSRELAVKGEHSARRSSAFIGGSLVRFRGRGSSVSLRSQTGRTIGVWVQRAPHLGSANVFAGGLRVGRINFAASTSRRALVLLDVPEGFTGAVVVVSRSEAPVQVDAITVRR